MRRIECTSCGRELSANTFPLFPKDSRCTHTRETCKRCWWQWLEAQVKTKTWDQISCPQCPNILGQSEVRALAKPGTYDKYLESELKSALSAHTTFRWCLNTECESGQEHTEGDIFRCVQCQHKCCATCNADWHEGERCEEYQERVNAGKRKQADEEAASAKAVSKISKMCPKCVTKIEKNGGCDHMTCEMCRHEFCWVCLADYKSIRRQGNSCHGKSCKYHSANIR